MDRRVLLPVYCFLLANLVHGQVFTQKQDLIEPRYRGISFALDGKLYAGTGRDGQDNMDNAMRSYDPTTDQWTILNEFPGAPFRGGISMVIYGVAYAGLGWDGVNTFTQWKQYDPASDTWIAKADVTGDPGAYSGIFTLNGKGYAVCGSGAVAEHNQTWAYDPIGDSWEQRADFPGDARDFPFADTVGGFAYVGLGDFFLAPPFFSDMYKYDPVADSWTPIAPIPVSSTGAIAEGGCSFHASYNGKIILMNVMEIQSSDPADFATVYVYDPVADAWSLFENTNPLAIRETPVIGQIGDKVYFGAGKDADGMTYDDFWEVDLAQLFTGLNEAQPGLDQIRVTCADGTMEVFVPQELLAGEQHSLTLYSTDGKQLTTRALTGTNTRVDVTAWAGGAYVYMIAAEGRTVRSGRVVLAR